MQALPAPNTLAAGTLEVTVTEEEEIQAYAAELSEAKEEVITDGECYKCGLRRGPAHSCFYAVLYELDPGPNQRRLLERVYKQEIGHYRAGYERLKARLEDIRAKRQAYLDSIKRDSYYGD